MPCRILIADDVAAMRALWRGVLTEDPAYEVVGEVADGAGAIAATRELNPDVLVLDLSMPGADGLEVIRTVTREAPETRIVVASGFAASRMRPLTLELGAAVYVEKGAPLHELREAVASACLTDAPV
jgi:DNA-binding NarL/FixJ family response regulator